MASGLNERTTPTQALDQALCLLRHASAQQWARGLSASVPLAAVLLGLYTLEHVVGARPPLALFGLLCALAYWARFRVLSSLARELSRPRGALTRATVLGTFRTAMVAGIGSWFWAVCLFGAARSSLGLLLVCIPGLCLRGALAPSLLARSACAPEVGLQALSRAAADTRGLRQLFAGVELLALLGLLLLFGNLYALAALVLLLASSVLGLDVGFVTALITPDNELVPLLLLGLAALVLEPLRAAISALAYQSARERWEGADLHAAIDALSRAPRRQPTAALLLVLLSVPTLVHAQPPGDPAAFDVQARERARAILARAEFLPSGSDAGQGAFRQWLDRRMRERELSDRDASAPPRFELSLPPSVLVLGSCVLLFGVGFWLTRSMLRAKRRVAAADSGMVSEPTSVERLAEATQLAAAAHYEASVRSLYAACLRALGRFDAAHTNGQVLQRIAPGAAHTAFERITQVFERCCYGRQLATRADYEHARALAEQILLELAS